MSAVWTPSAEEEGDVGESPEKESKLTLSWDFFCFQGHGHPFSFIYLKKEINEMHGEIWTWKCVCEVVEHHQIFRWSSASAAQ